ncbi:MAG: transketolase [Candidatus Buchananbacteria bacterium CG10_big_fil_rev_8_21_14_0_10_42_9]|uniref:Transketolase n=1 Tax=Candidatus Buchananbacteria bacterium CG10_big_fil_rev_8_21_14_0_10_42_9 TaxID=1974526 RepID=A0A2H0W461_9BACT|nr:MAG: transketolase [Candidatus Buchananbacteria bacterium CG10_big_fil_rev_8_21_14_0_10_42_9]
MAQKNLSVKQINSKANNIRKNIISSLVKAGSGHSAGPLGMAEVFAALYFNVLNHDPKKPWHPNRDRVILSAGHICPVWYATLAEAGYFPKSELQTLRQLGSRLQGHPHYRSAPGIENAAGPLGQGISIAAGMALAGRMDNKSWKVFCVMGDGEQQEGQVWEALWFAGKNRLSNLTIIVDRNNIQIDGHTEDVMPLEPFEEKYEAFNWHVLSINGHSVSEIINACEQADAMQEKPTMIIANTIPGKGVHFMEDRPEWHGKPPKLAEAKHALKHLRTLGGKIECHDYE